MFGIFFGGRWAGKFLLIQLMVLIFISFLFAVLGMKFAVSSLAGGLAIFIPNVFFVLFVKQKNSSFATPGYLVWRFAGAEMLKISMAIGLLIAVLGVFKALFWPVIVSAIALLVVQIFAPVVINYHHN